MESPQFFIEQQHRAKIFPHGQGEGGNANRMQAVGYLAALVPGFVDQFEDIEKIHAEMYMKQFIEYVAKKWGVEKMGAI